MDDNQKNDASSGIEPLLTVEEVALIFKVHPKSVYRSPARYGVRRIPGAGLRATPAAVRRIIGGARQRRPEE